MLLQLKCRSVWQEGFKLKYNGVRMKGLSKTVLWTLVGVQFIIFIGLYALSWRIALLEGAHEEPTEQKE